MKNFKRKKCYHLQRKEDKEHGQVIPKEEIDKKKKSAQSQINAY